MLVSIVPPTVLEEPTPVAEGVVPEAGTAEPEVIKKGMPNRFCGYMMPKERR